MSYNDFDKDQTFGGDLTIVGNISASNVYGTNISVLETQSSGITGGLAQLTDTFINATGDTMTGDLTLSTLASMSGNLLTTDVNGKLLDSGVNKDTPVFTGDVETQGNLIMPGISGVGIKLDTTTPTYGWRDITSDINIRGTGGNDPTWAVFRTDISGNISAYQFDASDECWINFHIPHDYVPGSEMYIHTHWGINGTAITTGSMVWGFNATYSTRNDVTIDVFPAVTTVTATHNAATVNIPQYAHVVTETQLTTGGGTLGGKVIEVDGILLVRVYTSSNTLGQEPFVFFADLHYQSTNLATKNRAPSFYT